jgi:hypothetical protein
MVCITTAAKQSKTRTFKNACISKIANNDDIEPLQYELQCCGFLFSCPYYQTKMILDESKVFCNGPKRFSP